MSRPLEVWLNRFLRVAIVLGLIATAGGLWWVFFSPPAVLRRDVARIVAGGDARLRTALAETDRLDPGWRIEQITAQRAARRLPDAQNSVFQLGRVMVRLPREWTNYRISEVYVDPRDPDEIPRGHILRQALDKLPMGELLPERVQEGVRAELAELAPAVAEARAFVNFPRGQTRYVPALNPLDTRLRSAEDTRHVARLLTLDIWRRILDHDANGAIESTLAMLNLSRSIGDEPALMSQTVRCMLAGLTVQRLELVLHHLEPSDAVLARIQRELLAEAEAPWLLIALRGERAMYDDLCVKLADGRVPFAAVLGPSLTINPMGLQPRRTDPGYIAHQHALGLHYLNQCIEAAKRPFHESRDFWEAWRTQSTTIGPTEAIRNANVLSDGEKGRAWYILDITRLNCAKLRATGVALACERFRLKHGDWPANLDELVPEFLPKLPLDPYNGEALRMRRTEEGLNIYAVGKDLKDDGGKRHQHLSDYAGFDIGFLLVDPAKRALQAAEQPVAAEPK